MRFCAFIWCFLRMRHAHGQTPDCSDAEMAPDVSLQGGGRRLLGAPPSSPAGRSNQEATSLLLKAASPPHTWEAGETQRSRLHNLATEHKPSGFLWLDFHAASY